MKIRKKPITKNMSIGDIVEKYPGSMQVMLNHGLHCVGCHVASWETLEEGAVAHGVDADILVNKLNENTK